MFDKFCQSCGMPMKDDTKHATSTVFCKYCADEKENLRPRQDIQAGISEWLKMFAPEQEGIDFMKRADNYLKAMPAWAD